MLAVKTFSQYIIRPTNSSMFIQAKIMRSGVKRVAHRMILQAESLTTSAVLYRKAREEGTIASVFASLSCEAPVALPERFATLKRDILNSPQLQQAAVSNWADLVNELKKKTAEIVLAGSEIIPEVEFDELNGGLSASKVEEIKERGSVIVRGVVNESKAREWLESIEDYISLNPEVRGYPENNKAVYELYWSKAQLEARSHPASLKVQKTLLSLFNKKSTAEDVVSFDVPLTYCDRLRIRQPGGGKFALGPHCDGGSVERWEDPAYRKSYQAILDGRWREHDPWDLAGRIEANMNMYEGPGACGVFRALQGWTSLSHTGPGEGTLKVFPAIKESSAYIMLRPFFKPKFSRDAVPRETFLDPSNWELDLSSPQFPNSPLGRSQELDDTSHPHLDLSKTMTSLKSVRPGDQAWWHCDGIHSVEAHNYGQNASSVMYIPSVPLTLANVRYISDQRDSFLSRTPPPDFPGGVGESNFNGSGSIANILSAEGRRAMGLAAFDYGAVKGEAERSLLREANAILGF